MLQNIIPAARGFDGILHFNRNGKDLSAPCMHVKSDIEHRNDDHGKYMILERDLWFVTLRHHQHIGIVDLLLIASSKQ